ncbi:hypothetical protein N864_13140 [Intrasporangium chromatireducens Q5-1]|uniref:Uncharacterized protein n=1 Tax=Intrasporangium chromatireducens Q5-1 TaxID=584657 RepID=W9GDN3_9MICO|nr:hypothetical protein N864_13140 [Intrasporangium chromatireducens Q5-1]
MGAGSCPHCTHADCAVPAARRGLWRSADGASGWGRPRARRPGALPSPPVGVCAPQRPGTRMSVPLETTGHVRPARARTCPVSVTIMMPRAPPTVVIETAPGTAASRVSCGSACPCRRIPSSPPPTVPVHGRTGSSGPIRPSTA